jgi:hypothetical protein
MTDYTVGYIDLSIELCVVLTCILFLYLSWRRVKLNAKSGDETVERRQIMRFFAMGFIGFRGLQFIFYMAMFSSPTRALEGCSGFCVVGMVVCFTAIMYNLLVNYFTNMNTLIHFAQSKEMETMVRRVGLVGSLVFSMSLIIGIITGLAADEPVIFVYTVGFGGISAAMVTFGALAIIICRIAARIHKTIVDPEAESEFDEMYTRYRRKLMIMGGVFAVVSVMALVFLLMSYVLPLAQGVEEKDSDNEGEYQYEQPEWSGRIFFLLICGAFAFTFWMSDRKASASKQQHEKVISNTELEEQTATQSV